jgi:hypothetical protein
MIDLRKLTPAPWEVSGAGRSDHAICGDATEKTNRPLFERWDGKVDETDAEFCCLSRNALDVMMRRRWSPWLIVTGELSGMWTVVGELFQPTRFLVHQKKFTWPDPSTALVEADKWYKENVEKV